jgi:hypothetical protein
MKKSYKYSILLAIVLISFLMHYAHFSKELISFHAWRQAYTQTTINNFYEEDFNILHPKINNRGNTDGIFRMEFPLMQWLIAGLYKIFGSHLIITRIFIFIIGLFSILGIYKLLLNLLKNDILALIGAWAFNFSPSFFYYTINPHPDNLALCFSIWGLAFFFKWNNDKSVKTLVLSSIFLCLGALCKLPFILYYSVPFMYLFLQWLRKENKTKAIIVNGFVIFGLIIFQLAWYINAIPNWKGNGIVQGLLDNKTPASKLFNYLQHNLFSTLPELLLNYGSVLFFIAGFFYIIKNKAFKKPFFPIFLVWSFSILAYFLFEINMIARVHDYYLFPFMPILFILISYGAFNLLNSNIKFFKYLTIFLLLLLPATAYMRMHTRWNPDSPGFNKDLLVYKDELRKAVPKNELCIVGNDESNSIFFYYIDKKGWSFDCNFLPADSLAKMIQKGAKYLYTDSRIIDENNSLKLYLDSMILEKGSIRVYKLKTSF